MRTPFLKKKIVYTANIIYDVNADHSCHVQFGNVISGDSSIVVIDYQYVN